MLKIQNKDSLDRFKRLSAFVLKEADHSRKCQLMVYNHTMPVSETKDQLQGNWLHLCNSQLLVAPGVTKLKDSDITTIHRIIYYNKGIIYPIKLYITVCSYHLYIYNLNYIK